MKFPNIKKILQKALDIIWIPLILAIWGLKEKDEEDEE